MMAGTPMGQTGSISFHGRTNSSAARARLRSRRRLALWLPRRQPARSRRFPRIVRSLDPLQSKSPHETIILRAISPRNDNPAAMPIINRVNENLAKLADGKHIRLLNINDKLADSQGKLFEGMINPDRLHPAIKGYQVW